MYKPYTLIWRAKMHFILHKWYCIKHFGNFPTILVDSFGQQLSRLLQKGELIIFATYLNLKMPRLDIEKITYADPTLKSPTPTSRRVSASNVLRLGRLAVCRVGLALTLTTVDQRVSLSRTISSRGVVSVASVESAFMTPSPRSCACRFLLAAALHFTAGTESAHDPHYDVNTITSGAGRRINRYPI